MFPNYISSKRICITKCNNWNIHLIPQTVPPGAPTDSCQVLRCPYVRPLGLKPAVCGLFLQSWWWTRLKRVNRYVWLDSPPCMAVWTVCLNGGTSTISNVVDMPVGTGIPVAPCWAHCSNDLPLLHLRYAQTSHCLLQLVCQFLPPFLLACVEGPPDVSEDLLHQEKNLASYKSISCSQ